MATPSSTSNAGPVQQPASTPAPEAEVVPRVRTGPTVIRANRNTLPVHMFEPKPEDKPLSAQNSSVIGSKPKPAPKPKPALKPKPTASNRNSAPPSSFSASLRFAQILEQNSQDTNPTQVLPDRKPRHSQYGTASSPTDIRKNDVTSIPENLSKPPPAPIKAFHRPTIIRASPTVTCTDQAARDITHSNPDPSPTTATHHDNNTDRRASGSVKDLIKNFPTTIIRPATYKPRQDRCDSESSDITAGYGEVTEEAKSRGRSEGMQPAASMPSIYKPTILRPVAISLDDNGVTSVPPNHKVSSQISTQRQ